MRLQDFARFPSENTEDMVKKAMPMPMKPGKMQPAKKKSK